MLRVPYKEKRIMNPASKVGDYTIEAKNYTQLRLVETLQQNKQYLQAKLLLKEINPAYVNKSTIALYQRLKRNQLSH